NIGRNQSEVARVAIETEFGLKKAAGSGEQQLSPMVPVRAMKVRYGVQATKQAISDTLSFVLSEYKFCSLPELNAILRLYNVTAEGGTKDSILYKKGGLLYFVTNENGKPVSAPVKASQFSMKPTLKNLRSLFLRNEQLREPHKKQLIVILNLALHNSRNKDLSQLADSLKNYRVTLLPRTNNGGIDYGITYIDHRSRCVFNESDLGKAWSAKAVCDYLSAKHSSPDRRGSYEEAKYLSTELSSGYKKSILTDNSHLQIPPLVPEAELSKESVPFPLHLKKRSRKRKQLKI
ncbi:MAG: relaxase, partial [Bacteroidota bacterium]